ncbi:GMC family oxidoreductase N-terminal domain-containing protein [Labrenzia sp. 011]|uniref:GMC family oxidoreductase n=1 Tax=Labrenzia sp. 011 TaxID=2171494 RepID=UPI000D5234AF|nr:GMC family oxidoreductase N-terminal domain-containing protein [Labrenzia sp. 011]PVB59594.1 pyridoxine 4-oxidase [Labrenzia sp. 011]
MGKYNVLIIGGGSAGCVLANRLSADGRTAVALVEAGGRPTDPDIAVPQMWPFIQGRDFDWCYETIPQPGTANRRHAWPRGKVLGGSSCLHAMAHVRGHPEDFASWADATGSSRWSYDGLLPGFIKSESFSEGQTAYHGTEGPLPVYLPGDDVNPVISAYMQAGQSLGVPKLSDHNGPELIGTTPNSLTIRNGQRVSAADAYLFPVLDRSNLTVLSGTAALKLLLDRNRVTGVEVLQDGKIQTLVADEYILSGGTIANPLLLMRSGIGPEEDLARIGVPLLLRREALGQNLQDHLLGAGNVYRSRKPVPPSKLQLSESLMYLSAENLTRSEGKPDVVLGCVTGPSVSECFDAPPPGEAYTLLFGVTHPTSRGVLRPSGAGLDDKPLLDPAYLQTEADRAHFRRALEYAREVGHSEAMSDWRLEEVLPGRNVRTAAEVDAFIARAAITHHHPVGTCRMGADEEAIVAEDLKVKGLDNLHIVDASVFPTLTSGPVHAAILAVAETFAEEMISH